MGILIGLIDRIFVVNEGLLEYLILFIGTCAALYPFFLCRMLGAGDIKLMALCLAELGIDGGIRMIFCGLLLVFLHGLWKGFLSGKMEFRGTLLQERFEQFRRQPVRLAGYLLAGYLVYLVWWR